MALVAFLRGVNVGGHRTFRPSVLARELARFDVVNIGAAGTFVARGTVTQARFRDELTRRLPFATRIMICDARDLFALEAADPFRDAPRGGDIVHFVSVMARRPRQLPATPVSLPAKGPWVLRVLGTERRFVTGVYRRQMKAIRYLEMVDTLCGVPVTTRNWNTIGSVITALRA